MRINQNFKRTTNELKTFSIELSLPGHGRQGHLGGMWESYSGNSGGVGVIYGLKV